MSLINAPRRTKAHHTGQADSNEAGGVIVALGLGVVREFALSDTAGITAAFAAFGTANAIEIAKGTGTLILTTEPGGSTTLGAIESLTKGWSADGLAITAITGGTVDAVRVRW